MRYGTLGLFAAIFPAVTCTGVISEAEDPPGAAGGEAGSMMPGGGPGSPAAPPGSKDENIAPWTLRRLTTREYNNTVRDLLGLPSYTGIPLPSDASGASGFITAGEVTTQHAQTFLEASEDLARKALATSSTRVMSCSPVTPAAEEPCALGIVRDFGKRAFRRPVEKDEVDDLMALYRQARGDLGYGFRDAIGLVVQTFLQSASFLYHRESGTQKPSTEGALVRLGPYEVASRLSYLLWETMPDPVLMAAADQGGLNTPEGVAEQALRLVSHPRASKTLASFHQQWLAMGGVGQKDPVAYPKFDADIRPTLDAEFSAFIDHVFRGDGRLQTLLAAPVAFATPATAKLYGVSVAVVSGLKAGVVSKIDLDPTQRAGLLTQLLFLADRASASQASVVKRGATIWRRLVCGPIGAPPANLQKEIDAAVKSTATEREKAADRKSKPACSGCHQFLDPPGLAFEHYDAVGAYRTAVGGAPVDSSGTFTLPSTGQVAFGNAVELLQRLATTEEVRRCVTRQWFRYALGRAETGADEGSVDAILRQAGGANAVDVRQIVRAIAQSRSFLLRAPSPGETP